MLFRSHLLTALAVVLLLSAPASAQIYTISNTTLNGAITATATTAVLTSASASAGSSFGAPAVGQCFFVEGELARITSVSSTTFGLQRMAAGGDPATEGSATGAVPHPSGAVVWTAPCNAFKLAEPPNLSLNIGAGQCNLQPAPWIDTKTANIWWCNRTNNTWLGTNYIPFTYGSVPLAQ